ncbi:MAG: glycosyltransferase family 2 protein [Saprospiraceae bacterium]
MDAEASITRLLSASGRFIKIESSLLIFSSKFNQLTLSILIPVYNEDVSLLVKSLLLQVEGLVPFEILCFDDGSNTAFKNINRQLQNLENVTYKEMPDNLGRSKIRNVLADAAKGPYLLFMDCDSKVVSDNYLKNYVDHLDVNTLLYGGRCYDGTPPDDKKYLFHWTYGMQREQQPAIVRRERPYHSFMTNNFLIPAAIFHQIRFDESLTQYGHEDTLFGMELKMRKIKMVHLDNPLEHVGLESAEVFLKKTEKAIENLSRLVSEGKEIDTKLLRAYRWMERFGLRSVFSKIFSVFKPIIYRHLISGRSGMKLFDIYKLGLLSKTKPSKATNLNSEI